jgi:AraC-like DNA-binding protein
MGEQRRPGRSTATFTPYYWEAYNEIVQPKRFDWYLIERWMPELGPVGFAIVKALRSRCYWHRSEGVLRDEIEVKMADLAQAVGVSEDTLTRQFNTNQALQLFVRKINHYRMVDGKPRKTANIYQVSMDDPIHAIDYERYDEMRARKEADRSQESKRITREEPYKPQNAGNRDSYNPQIAGNVAQNAGANTIPQNAASLDARLPSGEYIPVSTPGPGEIPLIVPPGEAEDTPEGKAWACVMAQLAALVQKGEINLPTWHGHLTRLRLDSLTETDGTLQAVVIAPSAFTRDWVEKRFTIVIQNALAVAIQRDPATVAVEFRAVRK